VATAYTLFGRWLDWVFLAAFLAVVAYAVARSLIARRQVK